MSGSSATALKRSPLLGIAVALALAGCRPDVPAVIDWDVSRSHTMDDVDWPADSADLDATSIEPVASVRIRLTDDHIAEAGPEVSDVSMTREGQTVTYIQIDFEPQELQAGYDHALALARQWGAPERHIHDGYQAYVDEKLPGDNTFTALTAGQDLSRGGPAPAIQVRYSFDEERPVIVSLQFSWSYTKWEREQIRKQRREEDV